MAEVKQGDKVSVHYKGTLKDGTLFESSEGREPLQFTVGEGRVLKGFDDALLGMQLGDKKTVEIPVDEAYGQRIDLLVMQFPIEKFPEEIQPVEGLMIHLSDEMGNNYQAKIIKIEGKMVTVDANHALAGKDLIFDIELVEVH